MGAGEDGSSQVSRPWCPNCADEMEHCELQRLRNIMRYRAFIRSENERWASYYCFGCDTIYEFTVKVRDASSNEKKILQFYVCECKYSRMAWKPPVPCPKCGKMLEAEHGQ